MTIVTTTTPASYIPASISTVAGLFFPEDSDPRLSGENGALIESEIAR